MTCVPVAAAQAPAVGDGRGGSSAFGAGVDRPGEVTTLGFTVGRGPDTR